MTTEQTLKGYVALLLIPGLGKFITNKPKAIFLLFAVTVLLAYFPRNRSWGISEIGYTLEPSVDKIVSLYLDSWRFPLDHTLFTSIYALEILRMQTW